MPARRTPRPLRSAYRPTGDGRIRDYTNFKYSGNRPSLDFDWDSALYKHALTMRKLGYTLTEQQQKRIDDHTD